MSYKHERALTWPRGSAFTSIGKLLPRVYALPLVEVKIPEENFSDDHTDHVFASM